MRKLLLAFLIALMLIGSFMGGVETRNKVVQVQIESHYQQQVHAEQKMWIMSILACFYVADSRVMHFVYQPFTLDPKKAITALSACKSQLNYVAKNFSPSESMDRILAEANLFYNGYREVVGEILFRQIQLKELYADSETDYIEREPQILLLEEKQFLQIIEAEKFLKKIGKLATKAWLD